MSKVADAICNRYKRNNLSETLEYYECHKELLERSENIIQTIGVAYRRMYDGGIERVLASLLHIWTEMNYAVILFTDEESDQRDYDYPSKVQRVVIPPITDIQKRLYRLEKEICARKVDVFIQNTWESEVVLWEMLLVKSHHIPYVIYTHGHFTSMYANAGDYAMISNRVFAMVDKIIALSDMNKEFYRLCGCNVTQIENPIAKELLKINPVYSERNNHHIFWIGRIASGKRLDDALKIFAEVKKKIPDAELDVIGNGSPSDETKAKLLCKKLEIENSVHFLGYQTEVGKYYQNSAVMLMTSEKEGYPTVLLESKAYGRATVMYSLPYLSLVKDGKGIRTAPIGDIYAMATQLCEVVFNETLRRKLENEARESFTELCQYDQAANWRAIFTELSHRENRIFDNQQDVLMLTMLLDTLRAGVRNRLEHSLQYQIGEKALKIPKAILRLIRRRDFK